MKKLIAIANVMYLFITAAYAQQPVDTAAMHKEVVVDSLWYYIRANEPVSTPEVVIDSAAIHSRSIRNIADVLNEQPSIHIKDYGGIGGLKTVSMEGLGAEHTNVILDGDVLNTQISGQLDLNAIFIENVDQINVGLINEGLPSASHYALPGAIVIHSQGWDNFDKSNSILAAGVAAGSFGERSLKSSYYLPIDTGFYVNIAGKAHLAKGGYRFQQENSKIWLNRTISPLEGVRGSVALGRLKNDSKWLAKVDYNVLDQQLPGAVVLNSVTQSDQYLKTENLGVKIERRFKDSDSLKAGISVSWNRSNLQYQDFNFLNAQGVYESQYISDRALLTTGIMKRFHHGWNGYLAQDFIIESLNSMVLEDNPYRVSCMSMLGARKEKQRFYLDVKGLLSLANDQFGIIDNHYTNFIPQVVAGFKPFKLKRLHLHFEYKRSFRLPHFSELYYSPVILPELKPETVDHLALKLDALKIARRLSIRVKPYVNWLENKIIAIPTQNLFVWSYQNIDRSLIKGVSISPELIFYNDVKNKITWSGSYTLQHVQNTAEEGRPQVPYQPYEILSNTISFKSRKVYLYIKQLTSGFKFSMPENIHQNVITGWTTLDVGASCRFKLKSVNGLLRAVVNNILDEQYVIIRSFPMPGRNYRIGLELNL